MIVSKDFAERCRPAAKAWVTACERMVRSCDQGALPAHYKPALEAEADRASKLLDEIDNALNNLPNHPPATALSEHPAGASTVRPAVRRMIENQGVYITGSALWPQLTIVLVSARGKLLSTTIDEELSPEKFMDDFVIKAGPFK